MVQGLLTGMVVNIKRLVALTAALAEAPAATRRAQPLATG